MRRIDADRLRALHAMGHTDREIARLLGADDSAVNARRRALGLASNYVRDAPSVDVDKLVALSAQGLSRPEVAKRLGCSPKTVRKWLHKRGAITRQAPLAGRIARPRDAAPAACGSAPAAVARVFALPSLDAARLEVDAGAAMREVARRENAAAIRAGRI